MSTFEYNVLTANDRLMKGIIEAGSREEAQDILQQMHVTVNSIEKAKSAKPKASISRSEFLLFNQQLASFAKTGVPLERGLRELSRDIASRSMRKLIGSIADDLEAGVSIEQAFEKHHERFPPFYGRILKAGVETGRLSEMLTNLNRHLEISNQTRRIVFEATAYPAVIFILGSVIMTFVFLFIIPQFEPILREMIGGRLNALTEFILAVSKGVLSFWTKVGLLVAALVAGYFVLSSFAEGRRLKETLVLKLPIFGNLYHSSILGKMAESMAMMVAAGADMPTVFRLASRASGSEKIILESEIIAGQIEKGTNILEAGQFCNVIPKLFLYSIQLGTQRNELQDNLYSLGQMYTERVRCSQGRLQAIMLPIMLIIVGSFIAVSVLAMFLPMIQVVTGLSGGS